MKKRSQYELSNTFETETLSDGLIRKQDDESPCTTLSIKISTKPEQTTTRKKLLPKRIRTSTTKKREPFFYDTMAFNRNLRARISRGNKVIDSRYWVCRKIGRGSMGAVYEVKHIRLNKRFALKIIHPELAKNKLTVARFHREASALSRIDHPNCVGIVDFGQTPNGDFYLVMEYVKGEVLAHLIEDGPFPVTEAIEITKQILQGLNHAHKAGIIHRDIKLQNLIKTENEDGSFQIKILDFGLAKEKSPHCHHNTITRSGVFIGTPQYLAPETIISQIMDKQSDLYTVGITFYRMLVGKPIFAGSDPGEVLQAKVSSPAPKLNDFGCGKFPKPLEDFLEKALAEPEDRFISAAQMLEELEKVSENISKQQKQSKERGVGHGILAALATRAKNSMLGGKIGEKVIPGFQSSLSKPSSHERGPRFPRIAVLDKTPGRRRVFVLVVMKLIIGLFIAGFFMFDSVISFENGPANRENGKLKFANTRTSVFDYTPSKLDILESKYTKKGRRLLLERNCRKAVEVLTKAVSCDPESADAHKLLGHAQMCLKIGSKGLASYKKAIESDGQFKFDSKILENSSQLLKSPKVRFEALDFMGNYLGESALPTLIELAETHPDKKIRYRAMEFVDRAGALSKVEREKTLAIDLRQTRNCDKKAKIVDEIANLDTEKAQDTLRRARDAFVRGKRGQHRFVNECVKKQINEHLADMTKGLL